MNPPDSDFFIHLWRGSTTLREALSQEPLPQVTGGEASLLMSTWAALAAGGSYAKLHTRLSWDGMTPEAAARRLASVSLAEIPNPEPAWLGLAKQVFSEEAAPPAWPAAFTRHALKGVSLPPNIRPAVEKYLNGRLEEISEPSIPPRQQPVLLRAMAEIALQSTEAVLEMLNRLAQDEKELSKRLADGKPLGQVTELTLGLSDPRPGQRQACRLRFDSGLVALYKPWSLDIDQELQSLTGWLRAQEGNCDWLPLSLRLVAREGYGWMPEVPPVAGLSQDYARQFGGLLAVLYALEARGLGNECVIRSSAGPILADAEAALQPLRGEAGADKDELLSQSSYTVLDTGLLPPQESPFDELQTGFRLAYTALMKHRPVLLGESKAGLSQRFEGRRGRACLRPLTEYRQILRQLRSKPCLRSGLWRGCAAESFVAPWIKASVRRPASWEMYLAELEALERWETPYLPLPADRCDLPGVLASPLEMAKRRLELLSEEDLERQQALLADALRSAGEKTSQS